MTALQPAIRQNSQNLDCAYRAADVDVDEAAEEVSSLSLKEEARPSSSAPTAAAETSAPASPPAPVLSDEPPPPVDEAAIRKAYDDLLLQDPRYVAG